MLNSLSSSLAITNLHFYHFSAIVLSLFQNLWAWNSSSEVPGILISLPFNLPMIAYWQSLKFQALYALMDIHELMFLHSKSIRTSVQSLPHWLHPGQITKKDQSCFFCQLSYNTFPSVMNSLEAIWVSDVRSHGQKSNSIATTLQLLEGDLNPWKQQPFEAETSLDQGMNVLFL